MNPWIQFAFVVIVLSFSGISWIVRKLAEQSQKKSQLDQRDRNRDEYLRTGRDPGQASLPSSGNDAQARLKELAARRQAQLKALRQQQARGSSGQAQAQPAPGGGPVRAELWPGGPVIEIGPKPTPAPQRPQVSEATRTAPPPPNQKYRPPPTAPKPRPPKTRAARAIEEPVAQTIVSTVPTPRPRQKFEADRPVQKAATVFTAPTTLDQWRAALIANELLQRPIALRSEEELAGH